MRTIRFTGPVLALAAMLTAQEGSRQPAAAHHKTNAAEVAYATLVDEYGAALAKASAESRAIVASDEYKAAREAKDQAKARELMAKVTRPNGAEFAKRFAAAAEQFAGDDRVPFLTWQIANAGDKDLANAAAADLLEHHLDSPRIVDLFAPWYALPRALGEDGWRPFVDKIAADSKCAVARAGAKYATAMNLQRARNASAEDKAMVPDLLAEAEALAAGTEFLDRIVAPKFQAERLQIGMEVPDIVGEDLDGVAFKLSDYRGKVVVLDFWGFW